MRTLEAIVFSDPEEDTLCITAGPWRFELEGADPADIEWLSECFGATLYSAIGFQLHAAQQGAGGLYFKHINVHAKMMEDTCGAPLWGCEPLAWGVQERPLVELSEDFYMDWKEKDD